METIEVISVILSIVMLIFGILQIILFFKIWGMTNDVQKIMNQTCPFISIDSVIKEIYKKNPNIESILFESLYNEMNKDEASMDYLIRKYKPLYEKAGIEMPAIFTDIHTYADFCKTFFPM